MGFERRHWGSRPSQRRKDRSSPDWSGHRGHFSRRHGWDDDGDDWGYDGWRWGSDDDDSEGSDDDDDDSGRWGDEGGRDDPAELTRGDRDRVSSFLDALVGRGFLPCPFNLTGLHM